MHLPHVDAQRLSSTRVSTRPCPYPGQPPTPSRPRAVPRQSGSQRPSRGLTLRAAAPDSVPNEGSSPNLDLDLSLGAARTTSAVDLTASSRYTGLAAGAASASAAASEQLLSRLRSESQGRLLLQQQLLELEKQNVESALQAGGMVLELEAIKRERSMLQERAERLELTLHMLEVRAARQSSESLALQDSMASLTTNRDLLLQERGQLQAALEQLHRDGLKGGKESQAQLDSMELQLRETQLARDAAVQAQEQLDTRMVATLRELQDAKQQQTTAVRLLQELKSEQQQVAQSQQQQQQQQKLVQQQELVQQEQNQELLLQQQQEAEKQGLIQQQHQQQEQAVTASTETEQLLQAAQLQLQVQAEQCLRLEQQSVAALAQVDSLRAELQQSGAELDEQEVALRRVTGDRDIIALNFGSSLRQSIAMMEERDAALAGLGGAQAAVQAAVQQQGWLRLELEGVRKSLAERQEELVMVEGARREAERKQADAQAALQALSAQFQAQEAALVQQLEQQAQKLAVAERVLQMRSQARAAARRGYAPGQAPEVAFVNTNRYWVPHHLLFDFMKALGTREFALQQRQGFIGLQVKALPDGTSFEVSSQWQSGRSYESWSQSREVLSCPLPSGVMQYVPNRGEGYPEDYMPFKTGTEAAAATTQ